MIREIVFGTPDFDEALKLRDKILRAPLGLEFTEEEISFEHQYYHLAYFDEYGVMIGILVLVPISRTIIQMKQVGVEASYQKSGIGTKLVQFSEVFCKSKGFNEMVLHARDLAVPFYKRLNYKIIGDPFEEVGITHFKMSKSL